jgi:peptide/nickel transport system substrate-binding protein
MARRHTLFTAITIALLASAGHPASGQTLRYANQGDLKSLDPYTLR